MMRFSARRRLSLATTVAVAAGLGLWLWARMLALRDTDYVSGWILLGGMLFLAGFNLRKKLPHPPLLRASTWLQAHLYIGLLAVFVFALHTGLRWPDGLLEIVLWLLFVLVALSGVLGIGLSRLAPGRLTVRGQEVIYERIPMFRRQLRERAEELAVEAGRLSNTTTLPDFYRDELLDFFARRANGGSHLLMSSAPLHRLEDKLLAVDRYLNDDERALARQLLEVIRDKDALDFHQAVQGALKLWLFVHVPATFALLLLAALHLVVVHAFGGGMS